MSRRKKWIFAPLLALVALISLALLFPTRARSLSEAAGGRAVLRYIALRSHSGWFEGGFTVNRDVMVPMRDGVRLATDLYLPNSPGPHPAIAIRTPYTKAEVRAVAEFFSRYGYAVVAQDTRGRHKSEGDFYPFRYEREDGRDLTAWIKAQSWCNGRIGGFGGSYLGFTQWAMAVSNPDLASIAPTFITANLHDGIYNGGAFGKLTFLHWSLTSYGRYGDARGTANIQNGYAHFPLADSDTAALRDIDFFNDWTAHPAPDAYWDDMSPGRRICEVAAPAFFVAGWFDFFRDAQIRDFLALRGCGTPAAAQSRILIGPWSHGFFNAHLNEYGIKQGVLELLPFVFVRESKRWLDYSLKGVDNGWSRRAPIRAFVLGDNEWRDEQSWPPTEAHEQRLYLHSDGHAGTAAGTGRLDAAPPAAVEPPDLFEYDPRNPVPTVGGNHGDSAFAGPADQSEVEKRKDVLVYSSAPLSQPLLVMGPVKLVLHASSSAPDTDFTAKLVDVQPGGKALVLCEGVMRARYRDGFDRDRPLKHEEVSRFEIDAGNTAVRFGKGHRIRLEVSSSNWPRYDANPNTGREIAHDAEPQRASQRVFHTSTYASALHLYVMTGQ